MKTITLSALISRYGKRADIVLSEFLVPMPSKPSSPVFGIKVSLPSRETFFHLRSVNYARPIREHVEEAVKELEALAKDVVLVYEKLSQAVKDGVHGKALFHCWSEIVAASKIPAIPDSAQRLNAAFVPHKTSDRRTEKRDAIVERLEECLSVLQEEEEDKFAKVIKKKIDDIKNIKFPSAIRKNV